ncbi:hypothetical protein J7384_08305 [Endozoicomonas sp. G2_1]|uniref:hypothetical protein n=1 Tax=Endozoicomonas sp. G2_1 TaxID=2821091 RepID=UPI001ADA10F6|nr:hypothetical protein [Endozoicomonas sp. G2_1]MBO9490360.1 hypothetical protein [Endozoicomonas sp. G2_1]
MYSRVPLPTDNIYKFYALFGLVIILFSFSSLIYVNKATNDLVFETLIKEESLKSLKELSAIQKAELAIIQRKYEIAMSDKNFYLVACSLFAAAGCYLAFYGFKHWHTKLQPLQDEIIELTIQKLKKELGVNLSNKEIKSD